MDRARFAGGHQAPAGIYREVHSGQEVHLHADGVLPGDANSDLYELVGGRPDSRLEHDEPVQKPTTKSEQD